MSPHPSSPHPRPCHCLLDIDGKNFYILAKKLGGKKKKNIQRKVMPESIAHLPCDI